MNKTQNTLSSRVRNEAIATLNHTVADLLTGILRDLDKQLWLLEAHINQQKNSK